MGSRLIKGAAFALAVFILLSGYSYYSIYQGVKATCIAAKKEFKQDCVGSLSALVRSDRFGYGQKNTAVWALGQLADDKAMPVLMELLAATPPQAKCKRSEAICRREIEKAIRWCTEGNSTSWMYRNRETW